MSWGSHLAEGERNGKKASTQVGHGSRWDTDCSVVYSCRGHSSALYGGQKLCLSTTFHSITDAISPAVLCVNIGQFKETWWWNIFPVSFHNGVISLGCVVFVGVISGLLFSSKCSHGRKASSKCSCFQCCKGNKKDNQECTGGTREKKKSHPTQRSVMIINISLCWHWITLYGLTRDVFHSGSLHQGSDYTLYLKQ